MLLELRIENFAIIPLLELKFSDGLIIFTGETGAGKSIILDALELLVGGKTDPTNIRTGTSHANLQATFRITESNRESIHAILQREDIFDDPNYVQLERDLRLEGRNTARINGHSVNIGLLRELGVNLIDIHGQSEHLSLLDVRQHLGLLDRFSDIEAPRARYVEIYHKLMEVRKELSSLRRSEQEIAQRVDLLTFQINEIEAARLTSDEEEETLRAERTRLSNAEGLAASTNEALVLLEENRPDAPSITELAGRLILSLHNIAKTDETKSGLLEMAENYATTLNEITRELTAYKDQIEFNPKRLDEVEERLELLQSLKRKYGGEINAVNAYLHKARLELDGITHAEERISLLEGAQEKLINELSKVNQDLSTQRKRAADMLSKALEMELADLRMSGARFQVDFQTLDDSNGIPLANGRKVAFDSTGSDKVEFLVAPNPGEGLKSLVKIASGGETSRLMLALKNVLARADSIPTLIFDEIDQGIGGRVGLVVGQKLWSLARQHQVFCVTHLPQLAAYGDQHIKVLKMVESGRTTTSVEFLTRDQRRLELAQMLGGVSQGTLQSVDELLSSLSKDQ
ncbi:MAG: DNA repair protein RecN [Anaerolineaceae bacterium]|nr:DNA repair protein RecN [Anaerolineaceae bacterium]